MRLNLAQISAFCRLSYAMFAVLAACAGQHRSERASHVAGSGPGIEGAAVGGGGAAALSGAGSNAAASGAAVPACTRAPGLDGPNAPRDSCRSASALLRCDVGQGATQICLSDDRMRCPVLAGESVAPPKRCTNDCAPNQYAVVCGGVGPNIGDAHAPEGCERGLPTPGGPAFSCCPCL